MSSINREALIQHLKDEIAECKPRESGTYAKIEAECTARGLKMALAYAESLPDEEAVEHNIRPNY